MDKKFSIEEARELLRRYRLGQCTERELEIIDRWYQSFDQDEVKKPDLANSGQLNDLKTQMFESIGNKIGLAEEEKERAENQAPAVRKLTFFNFHNLRRIAALLLVGTALGIFSYKESRNLESRTSPRVSDSESVGPQLTEANSPSTVYLADGSVVWLKEGSRLEYPETFSGNIREVSLSGEAFFDVAKDPERPFIIHSANFTTRVLGTSFNIKAYGNDESQEVVVVTGKVVVSVKQPSSDKVNELVLHPNQKAVYSKNNNSMVEADAAENAKNLALDKRKLAFDETSLEDIKKVLHAIYGVNISVSAESMNHCMITVDLTNETLEVGISILSKALNATYLITGKDIILRGNGCGI